VLVDSEAAWRAAEEATVTGVGGTYDAALAARLHGRGHRDGARMIAELVGRDDHVAIADTLLEHALARIGAAVVAVDGAAELVAALHGRVPIGVASNSVRAAVELALARAGLGGFDAVVCGDDVAAAKPAPDVYLEACRRLGVAPADAVAVEDSPAGVASARAAGLVVVGLEAQVVLAEAAVRVRTLRELRFDVRAQD
jgi:HAD superfamily hydrolase (TIGR01509 family)